MEFVFVKTWLYGKRADRKINLLPRASNNSTSNAVEHPEYGEWKWDAWEHVHTSVAVYCYSNSGCSLLMLTLPGRTAQKMHARSVAQRVCREIRRGAAARARRYGDRNSRVRLLDDADQLPGFHSCSACGCPTPFNRLRYCNSCWDGKITKRAISPPFSCSPHFPAPLGDKNWLLPRVAVEHSGRCKALSDLVGDQRRLIRLETATSY